jgi:hypothetical protein
MWAVDGFYYLSIEERYGTKSATDIDRIVWEIIGKIEARKIREFFSINGNDIKSIIRALSYSSWVLDLEDKEIILKNDKAIIRINKCRVQSTRIGKGLSEFGCKPVRFNFLKAFVKEFSSDIVVKCNVCPPDKHPPDLWCEWEFTSNKTIQIENNII